MTTHSYYTAYGTHYANAVMCEWSAPLGSHVVIIRLYHVGYDWIAQKDQVRVTLHHGADLIFDFQMGVPSGSVLDSDATLRSALAFCALTPGEDAAESFDDYTPKQMAWAEEWASALSLYAEEFADE